MTKRRAQRCLAACFSAAALVGCDDAGANFGEHPLAIAGLPPSLLVGDGGETTGDTLEIKHNSGFSLLSSYGGHWDHDKLVQLKLLGKALNFTVDLSRVGCACNLAVYLISMPAVDWSGNPSPGVDRGGQPPFYCDANQVGGQWCPEMDLMEANTAAFASTPHKCDPAVNGHYNSCDRSGCGDNTRDKPNSYGPGDAYTIDTRRPFQVSTEFPEKDGVLTSVRTVLYQSSKRLVLEHSTCNADYLASMGQALKAGMSLRITYWGEGAETMAWLDAPPCEYHQACTKDSAGRANISGISIGELPSIAEAKQEQQSTNSAGDQGEYKGHAIAIRGVSPAVLAGRGGLIREDALTMNHGDEFTLFSSYKGSWAPENIAQLKLLGKTIKFTVDLSKVGCACNLAFYLISMPARDWSGGFSAGTDRGGQPPYYCDANNVGGQWCPEVDLMEANNAAFQSTPHKCDSPVNGHYNSCDRGGCGQSTREMGSAYGPGESFTINTKFPFEVRTDFMESSGVLSGVHTILSQGSRRVVLDHAGCDRGYLGALSDAVAQGMSLRITYWGDDPNTMSWLDMPPCGWESCRDGNAGPGIISDIFVGPLTMSESDKLSVNEWSHVMQRSEESPALFPAPSSSSFFFMAGALLAATTALGTWTVCGRRRGIAPRMTLAPSTGSLLSNLAELGGATPSSRHVGGVTPGRQADQGAPVARSSTWREGNLPVTLRRGGSSCQRLVSQCDRECLNTPKTAISLSSP